MTRETQGHDKYSNLYWKVSHRLILLLMVAWCYHVLYQSVCVGLSYKSRRLNLVPVVKLCVQSLSDSLGALARPGASPSQLWPTCRVCNRKCVALSEPVGRDWLKLGCSLIRDCLTRGWTLFLFYPRMDENKRQYTVVLLILYFRNFKVFCFFSLHTSNG